MPAASTSTSTVTSRSATSRTPKRPNTSGSSTPPAKRRRITKGSRSVWNAPDDWDQLVADSNLSTASVSTRRPRPRGLQSLVSCAIDASARGFKRLWEDSQGVINDGRGGIVKGGLWRDSWDWVPDHLKERVREGVCRYWGGYLTAEMITEIFAVPPVLHLPGATLPALSQATLLKPYRPPEDLLSSFTSLILTHTSSATDIAIAGLIHHMQKLEVINLKGCTLAGTKSIQTIIKRCPAIRRLNFKGTAINEAGVKALLDRYSQQLEGFKVDTVHFSNANDTFASLPLPKLTHLCLPGDILNGPSGDFAHRARRLGHNVAHAAARPTPKDSIFDWDTLSHSFPSLTHLYLPNLFLPPTAVFDIPPNTLKKLSSGHGGPPIPIGPLTILIGSQTKSLRGIHLGNVAPSSTSPEASTPRVREEYRSLGEALGQCEVLEDFRLDCGIGGTGTTGDVRTNQAMSLYSIKLLQGLQGRWRRSLKHLSLSIPQPLYLETFLPDVVDVDSPVLERLELPSIALRGEHAFASALTQFSLLRSLDLSGTTITDEEVFKILNRCPLLSRIDLTSCRGVKVQHRRNIFKAWEEDERGAGRG